MLLKDLLRDDGAIFVSIDDNEVVNLRLMMDEIFGENNFVDTIIWRKWVSPSNDATWFSSDHDYIVVYAKHKGSWRPVKLPRTKKQREVFRNPDGDKRGPWSDATYTCNKTKEQRPKLYYAIVNPKTGNEICLLKQRFKEKCQIRKRMIDMSWKISSIGVQMESRALRE